jgi:hypothetical protein
MSICGKCGKETNDAAKYCKACGSGLTTAEGPLDRKKARVLGTEQRWIKPAVIAAAVMVAALAAWLAIGNFRVGSPAGEQNAFASQRGPSVGKINYTAVVGEGGIVKIPALDAGDRTAHFYTYSAGGKNIKFFVLRAADGNVRAAFDGCTVCYHAKLGYHQDGDSMVCNNCGRGFRSNDIGVITGGCNPIPLKSAVESRAVVLKTRDLEAGAKYF